MRFKSVTVKLFAKIRQIIHIFKQNELKILHLAYKYALMCVIIIFYWWLVNFQRLLRISRSFVSIFEVNLQDFLHSL